SGTHQPTNRNHAVFPVCPFAPTVKGVTFYRRRTNGVANACPRQGADRGGAATVQEADRAERDAEGTPRAPALREALRGAAASPPAERAKRPAEQEPPIAHTNGTGTPELAARSDESRAPGGCGQHGGRGCRRPPPSPARFGQAARDPWRSINPSRDF